MRVPCLSGVGTYFPYGPEGFGDGGGPPYNGGMEIRVAALESAVIDIRERLSKIETRLETTATREDLHKEINAQTWKFVTFVTFAGTALCGAVYYIVTHV